MKEKTNKNTKVKTTHHVCDYHKKNPQDHSYPNCTCNSSYELYTKPEKKKKGTIVDLYA